MSALTDMLDAAITGWWPTIKEKQAEFFGQHGRYWQGPWTHSVTPTQATAPDNLNQIQDTQSWADWNMLPATMRSRLRFDVLSHGNLHAFSAVFECSDEGVIKQKQLGLNSNGEESVGVWIDSGEQGGETPIEG